MSALHTTTFRSAPELLNPGSVLLLSVGCVQIWFQPRDGGGLGGVAASMIHGGEVMLWWCSLLWWLLWWLFVWYCGFSGNGSCWSGIGGC